MNAEEHKFVELFRLLAPDLADAKEDMIIAMRNLCEPMLNKERFGDLYDQALAYLVAHRLAYINVIAENGAGSSAAPAGSLVSEKEGDLARSYSSSGVGTGSYIDNLDKTAYGMEFKRIRDMCIVSIVTRFG